jgi:signal transduction histidine kinase
MSLRLRMVVITSVALAVLVVLGGALIVLAVRAQLIHNADEAGQARAEQVAELAQLGSLPEDLVGTNDIESAVQVVRDGHVISATENAGRVFAGIPPQAPGSRDVRPVARLPIDEDGPFRVTALGTRTPRGDATVLVAIDVDDVDEAVSAMIRTGALGLTLFVVALSGVFWVVVGRTLSSVEAIRRRAEMITSQRLDQRVPEPAAHDEVHRLARTLNNMLARLERSAIRQERFVADAAHEMRTPLASLCARLEATSLRGYDGSDEELVPDLLHEAMRLTALVDHLLLLARSDAGMVRAGVRPVDLEDVVREVVSSVDRRGVTLRVVAMEPVQVAGQATLLEQMVRNLVENAVRHASTAVDVAVVSVGSTAVVTVDDDGPGIPPWARRDVFRRFARLDDSRDRTQGGVGLGLAIVAEIVRVHSGSVEVDDSPTGGARLCVRLPVADSSEPATPPRRSSGARHGARARG